MNRNFMKFQNREIQGFDTDPDLWVDVLAQSWPSPVPREMSDARGWGCPHAP